MNWEISLIRHFLIPAKQAWHQLGGYGNTRKPEFQNVWVISQPHSTHVTCHAPLCYIQNATLLTFMPPFISIYMYMFELYISQLHPYEKYRKRQNTDCIFKQFSEGKKKAITEKERQLFSSSGKISVSRICFTDLEFRESPFWSDVVRYYYFFFPLFLKLKCEKRFEYIYTTLTLHKYRNNNYCTKYQQTGNKGIGFTT